MINIKIEREKKLNKEIVSLRITIKNDNDSKSETIMEVPGFERMARIRLNDFVKSLENNLNALIGKVKE